MLKNLEADARDPKCEMVARDRIAGTVEILRANQAKSQRFEAKLKASETGPYQKNSIPIVRETLPKLLPKPRSRMR